MPLGRESIDWTPDVWTSIDQAVTEARQRTQVAEKFLPVMAAPGALTVPASVIDVDQTPDQVRALRIDEAATTPLVDVAAGFALTQQQVAGEPTLRLAEVLAGRAAAVLTLAEDLLVFQGVDALGNPVFTNHVVEVLTPPLASNTGLVGAAPAAVEVVPLDGGGFGGNTFAAVAQAIALLVEQGQGGPYALVLNTAEFADTYAPLPSTLITTADRIKGVVTWFFGSGAVPAKKGLVLSLGGDPVDLVVGVDAITEYVQTDVLGRARFRVFERFAVRVKDATALVRLDFK